MPQMEGGAGMQCRAAQDTCSGAVSRECVCVTPFLGTTSSTLYVHFKRVGAAIHGVVAALLRSRHAREQAPGCVVTSGWLLLPVCEQQRSPRLSRQGSYVLVGFLVWQCCCHGVWGTLFLWVTHIIAWVCTPAGRGSRAACETLCQHPCSVSSTSAASLGKACMQLKHRTSQSANNHLIAPSDNCSKQTTRTFTQDHC